MFATKGKTKFCEIINFLQPQYHYIRRFDMRRTSQPSLIFNINYCTCVRWTVGKIKVDGSFAFIIYGELFKATL